MASLGIKKFNDLIGRTDLLRPTSLEWSPPAEWGVEGCAFGSRALAAGRWVCMAGFFGSGSGEGGELGELVRASVGEASVGE